MTPALKALAVGAIAKVGLSKSGLAALVGELVRGEGSTRVVRALQVALDIVSNPAALAVASEFAAKQNFDLESLFTQYSGQLAALMGIALDPELTWSEQAAQVLSAVIDRQEPSPSLTAMVICPNCNYLHGV